MVEHRPLSSADEPPFRVNPATPQLLCSPSATITGFDLSSTPDIRCIYGADAGWEAKEWGKKTVYVNHATKVGGPRFHVFRRAGCTKLFKLPIYPVKT